MMSRVALRRAVECLRFPAFFFEASESDPSEVAGIRTSSPFSVASAAKAEHCCL